MYLSLRDLTKQVEERFNKQPMAIRTRLLSDLKNGELNSHFTFIKRKFGRVSIPPAFWHSVKPADMLSLVVKPDKNRDGSFTRSFRLIARHMTKEELERVVVQIHPDAQDRATALETFIDIISHKGEVEFEASAVSEYLEKLENSLPLKAANSKGAGRTPKKAWNFIYAGVINHLIADRDQPFSKSDFVQIGGNAMDQAIKDKKIPADGKIQNDTIRHEIEKYIRFKKA